MALEKAKTTGQGPGSRIIKQDSRKTMYGSTIYGSHGVFASGSVRIPGIHASEPEDRPLKRPGAEPVTRASSDNPHGTHAQMGRIYNRRSTTGRVRVLPSSAGLR